jgi:alpha-tubulin suppressor-like RCC1 family protein
MFASRNFLFAKGSAAAPVVASGQLWSWGSGSYYQLGQVTNTTNYSSPKQVGSSTNWKYIEAGLGNNIAVQGDGTLWSWGDNSQGAAGKGVYPPYALSAVAQIGALTNWAKPTADNGNGGALKQDGTIWTWGANSSGQLGDSSTSAKSSPIQVGAGTSWADFRMGKYMSAAIKTDGSLWTWGNNDNGQLGLGNTTNYSSPKQVGALTNWKTVVPSSTESCAAVKTDGTLWTWGKGLLGQLGLGNTTSYSSPKQVGALTNWLTLSKGYKFRHAIKTDGTLWSWGTNSYGQLGTGNTINYSSPVQVGALTTWSSVGSIYSTSGTQGSCMATKTDGTLWTWGRNNVGQLGQGNTTNRSSPVQVGALTTWLRVASSNRSKFGTAIKSP